MENTIEKTKSLVLVYLRKEIDRIQDGFSKRAYNSMLGHFNKHFTKDITFRQLNRREKAKNFYHYLTKEAIKKDGNNLSTKSANKYFKRLRKLSY